MADAFDFDVSEFYDGERDAPTPDPFAGDRIAAIERELRALRDQVDGYAGLIEKQNALLAMQSRVLEEIQRQLGTQANVTREIEAAADDLRRVAGGLPTAPPDSAPGTG